MNYNEKYILIVNNKKDFDRFSFSFKNIMKVDTKDFNKVSKYIKENNYKEIIFVDYIQLYSQLINSFDREYTIKLIFTKDLATLSLKNNYQEYMNIMKLYNDKKIDEIGFLDKYFYLSLKDKINCKHILLDQELKECLVLHDKTVTIVNDSNNVYHSFFNELSAVSLSKRKVRLKEKSKLIEKFTEVFNIDNEKDKKQYDKSLVYLYVNFSNSDNRVILDAIDDETIIILGNTYLFDDYTYLKDKLVLKSDDDINEISKKIEDAFKNKDKIISEYKKFRKDYINNSRKSVIDFTEEVEDKKYKKDNSLLLSVIVPVYNTEDYIGNTLQSIIDARIKNMEILVINDGSTDNSENIIQEYVKKYPDLIKYFSKKNEGPGSSRNVGLKNARGKYISAVDSDDTINKNFYKEALKYLKEDIDMVIYDWMTNDNGNKYPTPAIDPIFNNKSIYEGIMFTSIMSSSCNKIYKKELFDELRLTYPAGKYEDFDTNSCLFLGVKTFKYIRKPYYIYYIRKGSIMRSKPEYDMINAISILDQRINDNKKYINFSISEFKFHLYSYRLENYIINIIYNLESKDRDKMIDYMSKKIKNILIELFNSKEYIAMLDKLDDKKKEYIIERNKAIKNDRFKQFVNKKIKEKGIMELTTEEIIYNK
jgi:glycosyltransferase involved in cell wall biosynthesis